MRNLISELLDFRKQEQGYLKLRVEEQNLVTFTRQIYMCFYEYAQKKEITYRFDSVEETISVWFDPIQLQKVIFNLLSNAFKYTSNKGNITVEVRKVASQAVVSVCDTGIGIPVEHISKIFDRFYQTDNASSSSSLAILPASDTVLTTLQININASGTRIIGININGFAASLDSLPINVEEPTTFPTRYLESAG